MAHRKFRLLFLSVYAILYPVSKPFVIFTFETGGSLIPIVFHFFVFLAIEFLLQLSAQVSNFSTKFPVCFTAWHYLLIGINRAVKKIHDYTHFASHPFLCQYVFGSASFSDCTAQHTNLYDR